MLPVISNSRRSWPPPTRPLSRSAIYSTVLSSSKMEALFTACNEVINERGWCVIHVFFTTLPLIAVVFVLVRFHYTITSDSILSSGTPIISRLTQMFRTSAELLLPSCRLLSTAENPCQSYNHRLRHISIVFPWRLEDLWNLLYSSFRLSPIVLLMRLYYFCEGEHSEWGALLQNGVGLIDVGHGSFVFSLKKEWPETSSPERSSLSSKSVSHSLLLSREVSKRKSNARERI